MGQPVVHWEFWSEEPARVSAFYEEVFGWEIQHVPELNYHMVDTKADSGIKGGIMTPQAGPWPAKLALYIDVDDLAAYATKITAAGGRMLLDNKEIPGVGHLSLFEDPDGRVLGMWRRA